MTDYGPTCARDVTPQAASDDMLEDLATAHHKIFCDGLHAVVGGLAPPELPPSLRYYEVIPLESLDRLLGYVKTPQ